MDSPLDAVRAWNEAAEAGDADALAALVHDDFEMVHMHRGVQHGPDAARDWLAKQSHGVGMRARPRRYFLRDGTVAVDALIELRWVETGELAETRDGAVVFVVRDGRIASLTVHPDIAAALAATGLDESDAAE